MSLALINEIWKTLKPSLDAGNVADEAAETLVNYLIEEDYSPAEIKHTFRGDRDIKDALEFFMESPEDGLYHETVDDIFDEYHNEDEEEDW
jgi:hypothetical protein